MQYNNQRSSIKRLCYSELLGTACRKLSFKCENIYYSNCCLVLCHSTHSICVDHALFSHCQFCIRCPRDQSAFYIFTETLLNKHAHNLHQKSKNIEPQPVLWKLSTTHTAKVQLTYSNVQKIKLIQIEYSYKKKIKKSICIYPSSKKCGSLECCYMEVILQSHTMLPNHNSSFQLRIIRNTCFQDYWNFMRVAKDGQQQWTTKL